MSTSSLSLDSTDSIATSATNSGDAVRAAVTRLKGHTDLPVAVGFGIRTPEQAAEVAAVADAAVVGTALVERVKAGLGSDGLAGPDLVEGVTGLVASLAAGVRSARQS